MRISHTARLAALATLPALPACADAPTTPGGEAHGPLSASAPGAPTQYVACGAEVPVTALATNARGRPAEDVLLNFNVRAGGGHVFAGNALTRRDGTATDYWTLGSV